MLEWQCGSLWLKCEPKFSKYNFEKLDTTGDYWPWISIFRVLYVYGVVCSMINSFCKKGYWQKKSWHNFQKRDLNILLKLCLLSLIKDSFSLDILLGPKISKRHFFGDISNSCQWVTQMGLEPHQNFFLENFFKNKAASPILSFLLFWHEIHF